MGIYYGKMLYGIQFDRNEIVSLIQRIEKIFEADAEEVFEKGDFTELEFKEKILEPVCLSTSDDGDRIYFIAIKGTHHTSDMYECSEIKENFQTDYPTWNAALKNYSEKTPHWYIMTEGGV